MSEKKHTPGPWVVDDCCPQCIRDDGGMDRIAMCHTDRPREEDEANAVLIATAPDMLALLDDLWQHLQDAAKPLPVNSHTAVLHRRYADRIDALIKKASP